MSVLDRHVCNPDLNFGVGLIHIKQTTEVHPFTDSRNVVTVTECTCTKCGATWKTSHFAAETVRKWNEASPTGEVEPRPSEPKGPNE